MFPKSYCIWRRTCNSGLITRVFSKFWLFSRDHTLLLFEFLWTTKAHNYVNLIVCYVPGRRLNLSFLLHLPFAWTISKLLCHKNQSFMLKNDDISNLFMSRSDSLQYYKAWHKICHSFSIFFENNTSWKKVCLYSFGLEKGTTPWWYSVIQDN